MGHSAAGAGGDGLRVPDSGGSWLSCLTVSQLYWWTAIIIGFVNAEF